MNPLRIKIIINPSAGRQSVRQPICDILGHLTDEGSLIRADHFYTHKAGDAVMYAKDTDPNEYDCIIAAGGDGTVHEVVNGLLKGKVDLPLAILPSGTVNDLAGILDIPTEPFSYAKMLQNFLIRKVDVGLAGDRYFMNVAAGGLLTDIPLKVPSDTKTSIGRLAYLLEGAKDLPANLYKSLPLSIESDEDRYEGDAFLFLISNSASVGGFRKASPQADLSDGKLDVLVISRLDPGSLLPLFGKLLIGDHIRDDKVTYFQTNRVKITSGAPDFCLDLDGEKGGNLPVEILCIPGALPLIVPE